MTENKDTWKAKQHLLGEEGMYRLCIDTLKHIPSKLEQRQRMKEIYYTIVNTGFEEYSRHKEIDQTINLRNVQWYYLVDCIREEIDEWQKMKAIN